MACKLIGICVLLLVVYTQAAVVVPAPVELEVVEPLPQYKYGYDVQDSLSGDSKSQIEERDGDVVRGEYSLVDPDGFRRTVTYTADALNGFQAVVKREPIAPIVKVERLVKV